jgi:hypothetical protein
LFALIHPKTALSERHSDLSPFSMGMSPNAALTDRFLSLRDPGNK